MYKTEIFLGYLSFSFRFGYSVGKKHNMGIGFTQQAVKMNIP